MKNLTHGVSADPAIRKLAMKLNAPSDESDICPLLVIFSAAYVVKLFRSDVCSRNSGSSFVLCSVLWSTYAFSLSFTFGKIAADKIVDSARS